MKLENVILRAAQNATRIEYCPGTNSIQYLETAGPGMPVTETIVLANNGDMVVTQNRGSYSGGVIKRWLVKDGVIIKKQQCRY